MKKTLLLAGGAAMLAGGLVWYFFSRAQKDAEQFEAPGENTVHDKQVAGEKLLRRAFRQSKSHLATNN